MRLIIIVITSIILSACASAHKQFYKPYVDAGSMTDVQLLAPGDKPTIYASNNMQRDIKIAESKNYEQIGISTFNGQLESELELIDQARAVRAVLVLFNTKFTDSRTITTHIFFPSNQVTHTSGTVYGGYASADYSATSTTSGAAAVPVTSQQDRYDQTAVYFVKSTKRPKYGVILDDLPLEYRSKFQRNNGALVTNVIEESPAFIANILPDDILVEFNGKLIKNSQQAFEMMKAIPKEDKNCVLKIIRNGVEKNITLQFTPS